MNDELNVRRLSGVALPVFDFAGRNRRPPCGQALANALKAL